MFRALANEMRGTEPFEGNYTSYVQQQTDTYTKEYANSIPTNVLPNSVLGNTLNALVSFDPNTRQAAPSSVRDLEYQTHAMNLQASKQLQTMADACSIASIDSLIGSLNPTDTLRCGWIYTKGTPGDKPLISKGALGTKDGPSRFINSPKGTWYWDLDAAKEQILSDRCAALTNCANVGAANYANCAWSASSSKGVPVDAKGQLLYPGNYLLNGANLITSSGSCPAPPPPGSPSYNLARSRDVCMPDQNGRLSRDCILQQITAAGCSMDGNLYTQLASGAIPTNYAKSLQMNTAFETYQQKAVTPLMTSVITDGRTSTQVALANFEQLAAAASHKNTTAVNFAARDLCLKQGTMAMYDFCAELTNTSPPPFTLSCLQQIFREMGGQPAGINYPTQETLAKWNKLANWGAVKDTIKQLQAGMDSSDNLVQGTSLASFLGIQREIPKNTGQIPPIAGLEVFWYNDAKGTFMGRQVKSSNPSYPSFSYGGNQAVDITGLSSYVSYTLLTNLRVPKDIQIRLSFTTDDGTMMVLNKDLNPSSTRNRGTIDNANTVSRNWDQPPTTYDANTCWNLTMAGPNYLFSYWQQTGGHSVSTTRYTPCSGPNRGQWNSIPSTWFSLTQEAQAPMIAWEGILKKTGEVDFLEYRLPSLFPFQKASSSLVVSSTIFPGLKQALSIKQSAYATSLPRQLQASCWRTMTLAATINSVPSIGIYRLVTFGYLTIDIAPKSATTVSVIFNWNSASLNTSKSPMVIDNLPVSATSPYLFCVCLQSQGSVTIPTQIVAACASLKDWANGNATLNISGKNAQSRTTSKNDGLYNTTDTAGLTVGPMNTQKDTGSDFTIGWIHIFDYTLTDDGLSRDASNSWMRAMSLTT